MSTRFRKRPRKCPPSDDNAVTSTTDNDSEQGRPTFSYNMLNRNRKRVKVLTGANSVSMGVPRYDAADMHNDLSETIMLASPAPRKRCFPTNSVDSPLESSRCLLNPFATLFAPTESPILPSEVIEGSKPSSAKASFSIPRSSDTPNFHPEIAQPTSHDKPCFFLRTSTPKHQDRVQRTYLNDCSSAYIDGKNYSIEHSKRKVKRSLTNPSAVVPAKARRSHARITSKLNRTVNLSASLCDISEAEPAEWAELIILDDSVDGKIPETTPTLNPEATPASILEVPANPEANPKTPVPSVVDLSLELEDGELLEVIEVQTEKEEDDEIEFIGMQFNGAATQNIRDVKKNRAFAKKVASTPKAKARLSVKVKSTPRQLSGVQASRRSSVNRSLQRLQSKNHASTAMLEGRRKSLAQSAGGKNKSIVNTPKAKKQQAISRANAKTLKRLGKTRWESPLKYNRQLTERNVTGWTERKYQQAQENYRVRVKGRVNYPSKFARGGAGQSQVDRFRQGPSRTGRYLIANPMCNNPVLRTVGLAGADGDGEPVYRNPGPKLLTRSTGFVSSNNVVSLQTIPQSGGITITVPTGPPPEPGTLRPIVIDGSNVAMGHGNQQEYSCRGIRICADHFRNLGHQTVVFVPRYRTKIGESVDSHVLDELEKEGILKLTPSRDLTGGIRISSYDDRYVVQAAVSMGGIIVSNDNFRDLVTEEPAWQYVIETRLLPFTFITKDLLMFPPDPLGRHGPSLHDFLRF